MSKKKKTIQSIMMAMMMAMTSFSTIGCQTKSNGTETDSTQIDSVQANEAVATQPTVSKEEDVLMPDTQEKGDTRVFNFTEYQGKKWTIKDNGEKVSISNGDKTFTLSNINLGSEEQPHYVLNVLDARIYKGKIWLITYDDGVTGRRAETEGTMFVYFDITTEKPHYVKSCSEANFKGKSIKYKEMFLTKKGESMEENDYDEIWRTYNLDENK